MTLARLFPLVPLAAAVLLGASGTACSAASADDAGSSEQNATAVPSCDARAFGAKGDGITKDTVAIQAAVDACAGKGGEVHLQNGTFLSGTITLKSHMTFHVHGGARLLGTQDRADYPDQFPASGNTQLKNCRKALVYADGVTDLHFTGAGIIDGNGGAKIWQGGSKDNPEATRPMAIFVVLSNNVIIENITVKDSAMWGVVNMETDNLTIRNITIDSTKGSTRDGTDVVDCHHVLIENITVSSGDDAICLKSGVDRGVDDVMVRNSHVLTSGIANGLKLGTASYGAFTNITFDTIDVSHVDKAGMAAESVDGALIKNLVFRNITLHDVGTPFFGIIGDRALRPEKTDKRIGSIEGLRFENITGDAARHDWGSVFSGLSKDGVVHRISNVVFQDVAVTMQGNFQSTPADPPEYGGQYPDPNLFGESPAATVWLRHTDNVTFTRTAIGLLNNDARPLTVATDSTNLAAPACDVTFTLTTADGAPALDGAGENFRILGRTTAPPGIGALAVDPAGDWQAATGGLSLVAMAPDASGRHRFTAHGSFPQGAAIDFKTIEVAGTTVDYERAAAGNRHFIVPTATSATVALHWEN